MHQEMLNLFLGLAFLCVMSMESIFITSFFKRRYRRISRANEGQVQEVLSSIRESSESEGQGSNSSLATYGDDPNMPTQEEVIFHQIFSYSDFQELHRSIWVFLLSYGFGYC